MENSIGGPSSQKSMTQDEYVTRMTQCLRKGRIAGSESFRRPPEEKKQRKEFRQELRGLINDLRNVDDTFFNDTPTVENIQNRVVNNLTEAFRKLNCEIMWKDDTRETQQLLNDIPDTLANPLLSDQLHLRRALSHCVGSMFKYQNIDDYRYEYGTVARKIEETAKTKLTDDTEYAAHLLHKMQGAHNYPSKKNLFPLINDRVDRGIVEKAKTKFNETQIEDDDERFALDRQFEEMLKELKSQPSHTLSSNQGHLTSGSETIASPSGVNRSKTEDPSRITEHNDPGVQRWNEIEDTHKWTKEKMGYVERAQRQAKLLVSGFKSPFDWRTSSKEQREKRTAIKQKYLDDKGR